MSSKNDIVYEEHVPSSGIFAITLVVATMMAVTAVQQILYGPRGSDPTPDIILVGLAVLFFLTAANFRRITVTVTTTTVTVAYGVLRSTRAIADIVHVERAVKPWYFGWGVRFIPYKGRGAWMFNAMGLQNVAIETTPSGPRPLLTASRDPDALIRAIESVRS